MEMIAASRFFLRSFPACFSPDPCAYRTLLFGGGDPPSSIEISMLMLPFQRSTCQCLKVTELPLVKSERAQYNIFIVLLKGLGRLSSSAGANDDSGGF